MGDSLETSTTPTTPLPRYPTPPLLFLEIGGEDLLPHCPTQPPGFRFATPG